MRIVSIENIKMWKGIGYFESMDKRGDTDEKET